LFKKTWGERAIIHVGVGLLFFFLYVVLFILCLAIAFTWLYVVSIVVLLLWIVFLATLSSTSDVIIKTILLHFAKYWELPVGLENEKSIIELAWEK
jgi:hypothetical protein